VPENSTEMYLEAQDGNTTKKKKPILYILLVPSITPEGSGPQSFT
jgi:hypothetical protein